jgi:hypothetical protein
VELSLWELVVVRVVLALITAPVVVATLYLIFAKRGDGQLRWWDFWR